jgi:hypothetical protein
MRSELLKMVINDAKIDLPKTPTCCEVPQWLVKRMMERVLGLIKECGYTFDGVEIRQYAGKPALRGVLKEGTRSLASILGVFAWLGLGDIDTMRLLTSPEGIKDSNYEDILRKLMDNEN